MQNVYKISLHTNKSIKISFLFLLVSVTNICSGTNGPIANFAKCMHKLSFYRNFSKQFNFCSGCFCYYICDHQDLQLKHAVRKGSTQIWLDLFLFPKTNLQPETSKKQSLHIAIQMNYYPLLATSYRLINYHPQRVGCQCRGVAHTACKNTT